MTTTPVLIKTDISVATIPHAPRKEKSSQRKRDLYKNGNFGREDVKRKIDLDRIGADLTEDFNLESAKV